MDGTIHRSNSNDSGAFHPFPYASDSFGFDHALQDDGFTELSAALTAAQTAPVDFDTQWSPETGLEGASNGSTAMSSPFTPGTPITRPKLGSRFSREVIRTLKTWLVTHQQHPYPREDDMVFLQQRTGLNQAQLANWFANARRRGKVQSVLPASPQVSNAAASPVDIIQRPGTPAVRQDPRSKDPLQRWVDSPPEHEPADVGDIARAMASSSRNELTLGGVSGIDYAHNDPWRSPYALSSASSAATSHSSKRSTHYSSGSQSSLKLRRPARRKRASRRRRMDTDHVPDSNLPYQCTFCTETFRTKHDWQRHEKSLHLPLEQWVCGLHGPRATKPDSTELCCVFCGRVNPEHTHVEAHNYSACSNRSIDERTFHRKDHLVQHLRLVHNAKFESWSMKSWMIPIPDIKSRCGFCFREMSTWVERTDHLGDHFKSGTTMAEWKGDWGFDNTILPMIECSIPPYMIDYERSTLVPMRASDAPWGSPPNAYELLKIEIEFFIQNYVDTHRKMPTNDAIQLDACRVIFAAEAAVDTDTDVPVNQDSWLRDLILSSSELAMQARFSPIRTASESRHSQLKANGKDHLFEQCPLEQTLRAFVFGQQILDAPVTDGQLQTQMCEIIRQMETNSITPSDMFANWIFKGIYSSPGWLSGFRQRAGIVDLANAPGVGIDLGTTSQHPYFEGIQVAQSTPSYLPTHGILPATDTTFGLVPFSSPEVDILSSLQNQTMFDMNGRPTVLLPDDTNFHQVFERDIRRWVAATMSPKNPNCHVPSDEEIQHQGRWIMYGTDDPFDQTPADYQEWLWRFKRDVGILNDVDVVNPAELTRHQQ
ncbi:hypothetical protein CC86DRAFT_382718 [Ophiobolus disseminans]|uniref:Homeobox domain-containing protein n=1 Tax=Ophiobolus disseminans TaxID=1469910 RepID=A0A6A6ZXC6_9PLEO|nr:hypothetical protein CC86DRAFT_382718 [Ophiobolus disseminans]